MTFGDQVYGGNQIRKWDEVRIQTVDVERLHLEM